MKHHKPQFNNQKYTLIGAGLVIAIIIASGLLVGL